MFALPTFDPGQPNSFAIPSRQSGRKGYYKNLKSYTPYATRSLLTTDPQNAVGAVIFHNTKYYWLRLESNGEVRPVMHVELRQGQRDRVSLLPCTAANDQLLREESTCIYLSTCLVWKLSHIDGSWHGLAGVSPLSEGLPQGYIVNRDATVLQYRTSSYSQVYNFPILQLSKEGPSGKYVGEDNSTLLWDPLCAYYGRPFELQPNPANIGTISLFPPKSTSEITNTGTDSSNERKFATDTALRPKGSGTKLRATGIELRDMTRQRD